MRRSTKPAPTPCSCSNNTRPFDATQHYTCLKRQLTVFQAHGWYVLTPWVLHSTIEVLSIKIALNQRFQEFGNLIVAVWPETFDKLSIPCLYQNNPTSHTVTFSTWNGSTENIKSIQAFSSFGTKHGAWLRILPSSENNRDKTMSIILAFSLAGLRFLTHTFLKQVQRLLVPCSLRPHL